MAPLGEFLRRIYNSKMEALFSEDDLQTRESVEKLCARIGLQCYD